MFSCDNFMNIILTVNYKTYKNKKSTFKKMKADFLSDNRIDYLFFSTHLRALTNASTHGVIWSFALRSAG